MGRKAKEKPPRKLLKKEKFLLWLVGETEKLKASHPAEYKRLFNQEPGVSPWDECERIEVVYGKSPSLKATMKKFMYCPGKEKQPWEA